MKRYLVLPYVIFFFILMLVVNITAFERNMDDVTDFYGELLEIPNNDALFIDAGEDFQSPDKGIEQVEFPVLDKEFIGEDLPATEMEFINEDLPAETDFAESYEESEAFSDPANEVGSYNTRIVQYEFEHQSSSLYLPLGGDVRQLDLAVEVEAYSDWFLWEFSAEINWLFDDFDSSISGLQVLQGDILMPEGYYNEGELPLNQKVYVYGPEEDGPWNSSGIEINEIKFETMDYAFIMALGEDVRQFKLPVLADGDIYESPMSTKTVPLELHWQYTQFENSRPGRQMLMAEIVLPEGYFYYGDSPKQLFIVYNDDVGMETIVRTYIGGLATVPSGDDEKALNAYIVMHNIYAAGMAGLEILAENFQWLMRRGLYSIEGGYTIEYPLTYDLSLIDIYTPGLYYPFSPLPDYFTFDDFGRQGTAVAVQDPDEVDLSGWSIDDFGTIVFSWYKGIYNPELWVSIDEKDWQPGETLKEEAFWMHSFDPFTFTQEYNSESYYYLYVDSGAFPEGHKYELAVRYEDNGVSVNSMIIDFTNGKHVYYGNGGGSRDGDGREESNLPKPGENSGSGKNDNEKQPPAEEDNKEYIEANREKTSSQDETDGGDPADITAEKEDAITFAEDILEANNSINNTVSENEVPSAESKTPFENSGNNPAASNLEGASDSQWQPAFASNTANDLANENSDIYNMPIAEAPADISSQEPYPLGDGGEPNTNLSLPEPVEYVESGGKSKMEQYASIAAAVATSISLVLAIWKFLGKRLMGHGGN